MWYLMLVLLFPLAIIVALPAVADIMALVVALRTSRRGTDRHAPAEPEPLLFLVPAHDEELLIERCVRSLTGMDYPPDLLSVLVVADNCTDATAEVAARAGANVLVRTTTDLRGKSHAIEWALARVHLAGHAAVVIVDADTIVEADYAAQIAWHGPLRHKALQTYDGMSNEFENWLTRLAGLLTRNRYHLQLPLKQRAGLNVPLTGDGTILGTSLLRDVPWQIETITEGWELYARYTLMGLPITYVADARLYAQEARSLGQSHTQRARWSSGRFAVLRIYLSRIAKTPGVSMLQRLDLIAELTHPGPATRAVVAMLGMSITALAPVPASLVTLLLFSTGVLHPMVYSVISLRKHPCPGPLILALTMFPFYAVWRFFIGLRAALLSGTGRWVRTKRHIE